VITEDIVAPFFYDTPLFPTDLNTEKGSFDISFS